MASTIAIDSLSPSQRDLTALYLVSFTIGTTPVPTGDGTNGGMIILQHPTGVTTSSGCTASGAGVYYNCVASSANRTYTVYSTNAAIPAGTVLTIFAHNTNPATCKTDLFSFSLMKKYRDGSDFKCLLQLRYYCD